MKNQRTQLWVCHMCAHHVLGSNIETGSVSSYFEQPYMLCLVPKCHTQKVGGGGGGGKINCSKNRLLGVVRASLFWRAPAFETTFGHIQNFWQKQDFPDCSSFALKTHWWKWALILPKCSCRHFCLGTESTINGFKGTITHTQKHSQRVGCYFGLHPVGSMAIHPGSLYIVRFVGA